MISTEHIAVPPPSIKRMTVVLIRGVNERPRRPSQTAPTADYPHRDMAYGKWTCEDGRQVLYNRRYQPIWQRYPGDEVATRADPAEVVAYTKDTFTWWTDFRHPKRHLGTVDRCLDVLVRFGVPLADIQNAERFIRPVAEAAEARRRHRRGGRA
jgi:hypothetical protein